MTIKPRLERATLCVAVVVAGCRRAPVAATAPRLASSGTMQVAARTASAASPPAPSEGTAVRILAINDFHGRLSPKDVSGRPAGGAAVLASYLRAASSGAEGRTFFVHAGDAVGASPLSSALLEDEPAIMFLDTLANAACSYEDRMNPRCNMVGVPGNHEFDEGSAELLRLVRGGDSSKGPFLERPWRGARFPYVAANLVHRASHEPVFPPYVVDSVGGVSVAFVGAVLRATPSVVPLAGIADVEFGDEADAVNRYVPEIQARGVHAIVVVIHQGLTQPRYEGPTDPSRPPPEGELLPVIARLDDDVDVVVSGHTHQFTNALVRNAHGVPMLVTQAFSNGTAYADIDVVVDGRTHDVVSKSARIVTTWADAGPGLTPDPAVAAIVAKADAVAAPIGGAVVGVAGTRITHGENAAGESALGDLAADAQRAAVGAEISFMNPGGIRDDLPAGPITYAALFSVQPFGNTVTRMTLTGQQIYELLNQQWGPAQPHGGRILQVSGLTYTWDAAVPEGGERVKEARDRTGAPLSRSRSYVVAANDYLVARGDAFAVFSQGAERAGGPVDVDALVTYVRKLPRPFTVEIEGRIHRR
jgi:5'-nucleotidase